MVHRLSAILTVNTYLFRMPQLTLTSVHDPYDGNERMIMRLFPQMQ